MKKQRGYNREVLRAMVRKYRKILKMDDEELAFELEHRFRVRHCPCCDCKFLSTIKCSTCPAKADEKQCFLQSWFKEAIDPFRLNGKDKDITLSRKLLTKRMQWWRKKLYKEYPNG